LLGLGGLVVFFSIDPIQRRTPLKADILLMIGIVTVMIGSGFIVAGRYENSLLIYTIGLTFIWSIGSPICQTVTVSSLSIIMGSRPQGAIMGWLTNAGSLGRILFPGLAGLVDASYVHILDIFICLLALIFLILYKYLINKGA